MDTTHNTQEFTDALHDIADNAVHALTTIFHALGQCRHHKHSLDIKQLGIELKTHAAQCVGPSSELVHRGYLDFGTILEEWAETA